MAIVLEPIRSRGPVEREANEQPTQPAPAESSRRAHSERVPEFISSDYACADPDPARQAAWAGISAAFASLGRVFVSLDDKFRVLHASSELDRIMGNGTVRRVVGRPAEEFMGADLFGPAGVLRQALLNGERREGWRGVLVDQDSKTHIMSVTVAPLNTENTTVCDPNARFVVVLRPAVEEVAANESPMAFLGIVARAPAMLQVLSLVQVLRDSLATVLISGESGVGKEVVARALHLTSKQHAGAFVAVNCGALPSDLLESELFGHVKGAFTGAIRDRVGRFEEADGGTLFLDEIGELPLPLQVKLLRVLQEQTYERVGESKSRRTNARIVAATNRDLAKAVDNGEFRQDLYYRLRVVPVHVSPLRERREDIEPLARHFLARIGVRNGRTLRFSPDTMRAFLRHSWPGNVRELLNAVEYAVAVCRRQTILPEDLPSETYASPVGDFGKGRRAPFAAAPPSPPPGWRGEPIFDAKELAERHDADQVRAALEANRWNRAEAAKALGISRTTLWRKMRRHGLAD